ncbi:plasmid partitioning protein [Frankia sp. CcI156]|nr:MULTISPECIES: PHB depolymerase family esterase [unclassified Frankia]OFB43702.1 plasmid partitioning protein [Frankia sp. CgIM4]ONH28911.1 plasmid partitioning protein [Frankia sp. CcI156]ORT53990.1 plasmid partitioning protein [Frankia sp. KB5]OHV55225.1 plasmid partitioning protein [Frankia sp. CgIS1]TFE34343.1 plasmid partitioning protein [Frankia sp. B2]
MGAVSRKPPPARWHLAVPGVVALTLVIVVQLVHGFAGSSGVSGSVSDKAVPRRFAAGSGISTAGSSCVSPRPAVPLLSGAHSLVLGGVRRYYRLTLPVGHDGRHAYPLIFDFHGFKADKELEEQRSRMGALGGDRGFIVVTPDALGTPRRWNTLGEPGKADDFGFVNALLDDLDARFCLDDRAVYAAGHSNGAEFAAALVCRSGRFAAVAMVSSTFEVRCPPGRTPATMAVHGTADPSVPYAGGAVAGGPAHISPAPAVIRAYADRYGCNPTPVLTEPRGEVIILRYVDCLGGAEVRLDTVTGGTHLWPASPEARRDRSDSAAGRSFDATGAILDFFTVHHMDHSPVMPPRVALVSNSPRRGPDLRRLAG